MRPGLLLEIIHLDLESSKMTTIFCSVRIWRIKTKDKECRDSSLYLTSSSVLFLSLSFIYAPHISMHVAGTSHMSVCNHRCVCDPLPGIQEDCQSCSP